MAKQVVARSVGFYGGIIRKPGEHFTIAEESDLGSWMSPVSRVPDKNPDGISDPSDPVSAALAVLQGRNSDLEAVIQGMSAELDQVLQANAQQKAQMDHDAAVFASIRSALADVHGLPPDLNLAEAVDWMAHRLSPATVASASSPADGTATTKPKAKKE